MPSSVYLLAIRNGANEWLKLGYAKDIDTRASNYGLPATATIEKVVIVGFDTGNEAHSFKVRLHTKYAVARISNRKVRALGMVKTGFAECYPMDMLLVLNAALTTDQLNH